MSESGGGGESHETLDGLLDVLGIKKENFNKADTRALIKQLSVSAQLCDVKRNRVRVHNFLDHLSGQKYAGVQEGLYLFLLEHVSPNEGFVTTPASSKSTLELLTWLTLTGRGNPKPSTTYCKLFFLLFGRVEGKRLEKLAEKRMYDWIASLSPEARMAAYSEMMEVPGGLLGVPVFLKFWMDEKIKEGTWEEMCKANLNPEPELLPDPKKVAELYVKECLMNKTPKSEWFLKKASEVLRNGMRIQNWDEVVFPAVQKAMLRSPEIAIQALPHLFLCAPTCTSIFVPEIKKFLGSCLYSKEDATREYVRLSCISLANRIECSNLDELVIWFFDIYNGSEGKLTVAAHKIGILKVIEEIGRRKIFSPEVRSSVMNKIVKVLETEVHEGTLIQAFKTASKWLVEEDEEMKRKQEQNPALAAYFSKNFGNLKGAVRPAACSLLACKSAPAALGLEEPAKLVDFCVKGFEKSYAQVTQSNGLTECIEIATTLVLNAPSAEKNLDMLLSLVPHINEKFILGSSREVVTHAAMLLGHIMNANPTSKDRQVVFDAYPVLFANPAENIPSNYFEPCWDGKYKPLAKPENVLPMISSFEKAFRENIIPEKIRRRVVILLSTALTVAPPHIQSTCYPLNRWVKSKKLLDELKGLGSQIGLKFLNACHLCPDPDEDLWVTVCQLMGVDPATVLKEQEEELRSNYFETFDGSEVAKKVFKTIAFVGGEAMVDHLIREFIRSLEDPEIFKVTRDEYFVFLTPEDQLFDTSVIESLDESAKNMKRESRVYSYKEQLEEIQLRKELEQKRKLAGKPIVYSAKQKEAIKAQMEKEKVIRLRVAKLHNTVRKAIGFLQAAWEGNVIDCGSKLKRWITKLVEMMRSPLSAEEAVKFFRTVGKTLFKPDVKAEMISQISILIFNPACDFHTEWKNCPMQKALKKAIECLTVAIQDDAELSGVKFSYAFPMLRLAVQKFAKNGEVVLSVLQFILAVCKDQSTISNRGSLIPRQEMLEMLYNVIGTNSGSVQQNAVLSIQGLTRLVAASDKTPEVAATEQEFQLHINALLHPSRVSRITGIRCISMLSPVVVKNYDANLVRDLAAHVFRETFDFSSEVSTIAEEAWTKSNFPLSKNLFAPLYDAVLHPCEEVRTSASKALAAYLKAHSSDVGTTLEALICSYQEYNVPTPPLLDNLGRVLQEEIDRWEVRCGVGLALREIAPEMSPDNAKVCMEWLVTTALSDRSPAVHNIMLEAAVELVQAHGPVCLNEFITTIETFLERAGSSGKFDNVRQACVVLMGGLAKHLNPTDGRVKSIFTTLIETLSTPSEKVQEAVANCLPGLVPAISTDAEVVLKKLLEKVMEADNFGERRGAAFGIAGMIKGLGILSLKQHDIMNILATGMQDKKNFKHREGALMCLELLCEFLGRLFEPYIVHVLPYLLQCLGDSNVYVREATENTAKRVMSRLSAHGVKLVLPSLIGALNEDSWRTKCGSVDLLGRMAYCAPKQLSGCLPMIVPRLTEVLGDSHVKVQEAGAKALRLIGSVIQNPEIQSVVPVLLEALQDPSKKSTFCLQCLLQTEFVHFVDPPSLALIMPVVQRAFQDRSTENRKMACQVIGNMYSLTDHSDLAPYMESVMPGIRASLVDPVPEVRAVAAKALGSMAKGMGEKCYDELLPWLMKTLVSEANSVDRSGAAQGLAEVIGALGEDKLHRFMPEIIRKADSDDLAPHVRDGYMMMFIYMPGVFEKEFVPYIGQIINPVLKALADENEFVRETALRAGQRIVTGFAESAITLLLPELEKGIFDDNWRIRFSSIQLLGDLLYKISGVSGKMSTESAGDDDNFGTEQSQQAIVGTLGIERRNRVLAGLYMSRSDVALMVRQAALHVWKVVVANTPKTLREILPTLFSLLLGCLASSSHDKRQVAARTLGDLVRKLGEKILPEIIPILEKGLDSDRNDERQGVCIGLSEIMAATSREMVLAFVDNLVPTLRKALCDPSPEVRAAAAKTFSSLHSTVGSKALEEVVPYLMKKLGDSAEGEYALDGLGQILQVKSKAVMPYLIPQLTARPVNTKALAILASVAGDSLSKHLGKIIPALMFVLAESHGTAREKEELEYCERVILTITDEHGVRLLIDDLLEHMKDEKPGMKRASVTLLSIFCIHTKADIEPYISQLIRGLILLMTDTDEVILNLVADALAAIIKGLDSAEKLSFVGDVRLAVRFVQGDLKGKPLLPGLCTPKGINPVLPIFREALLNGGAEVKEQAALGMGELIALSSDVALKPSVIHITGPLIRILGDRYGPTVKIAVMDTLTLLLMKVGVHLKAFLPQLQTTFVKAANDGNRSVRVKAANALAQLIPFQSKPDPTIQELINAIKAEDA